MQTPETTPVRAKPLLEIGVVLSGELDSLDRHAVECGVGDTREYLESWFAEFQWRWIIVRRGEFRRGSGTSPIDLIEMGAIERHRGRWDFAVVVTGAELIGRDQPLSRAAVSRSLDTAVLSTLTIDPAFQNVQAATEHRRDAIRLSIVRLLLHCVGHLGGLSQTDDDTDNFMSAVGVSHPPEKPTPPTAEQSATMMATLRHIADERLEETQRGRRDQLGFFVRAAWINRYGIVRAVLAARPWELPRRLSKLTSAAVSATVVLLITAEAWDLGLGQSTGSLLALWFLSLVGTTLFVAARQRLLRYRERRWTEQTVTSVVASITIIGAGLLTTFLTMAALSLTLSGSLFSSELIEGWAANAIASERRIGLADHLQMAAFAASFSMIIGSLGASFESQSYFRNVILIDEEF